jgi:2-isopropylmalate synthase
VAFVMERDHGLHLPRWLQVELAGLVQAESERRGGEIDGAAIHGIFLRHFVESTTQLIGYRLSRNGRDRIEVRIADLAGERVLQGEGEGAIAAFVDAWARHSGQTLRVVDYAEHAIGEGTDAEAAAYVQLDVGGQRVAGASIDRDTVSASLKAVIAALGQVSAGAAQAA